MPAAALAQDVRSALRGLRRSPAFALAAILTLAVGIAAAASMFALVRGVLLRPLPVREPERLFVAWSASRTSSLAHYPFRAADVGRLAAESRAFEGLATIGYNGAQEDRVKDGGAARHVRIASVGGRFFDVAGVRPVLGRTLVAGDDVPGAERALVLAHGLWRASYGASPDVIGRRVLVSEQPFTIVGVAPAGFEVPRGTEAWATLAASASTLTNPAFREGLLRDVDVLGRLRPGATPEQARAELRVLSQQRIADAPRDLEPVLRPLSELVVGDVRRPLLLLLGAVGLVLVAAGANVSCLLLARGESRRREMAVRAALGAGRVQLAAPVLVECLVLALAAAAIGWLASHAVVRAVLALAPSGLPRADVVAVDGVVLLFASAAAFATTASASLAPVLVARTAEPRRELQAGRGARGASRRWRAGLVAAQVALAVATAAGALLLGRSLARLHAVDLGIAADRLVFVELALPEAEYADRERLRRFLEEAVARLEATPGIAGATPVNVPPFAGTGGWDAPLFTAEGQDLDAAGRNPSLNFEAVFPGYFHAFAVPLVRGRAFTAADRAETTPVAVVSEDVAARVWPGADAVGQRIKLGGPSSSEPWRTVVGVARATRYRELVQPRPTLYLPAAQFMVSARRLVLRAEEGMNTAAVAAVARARVREVDPAVEIVRVARFAELLGKPLARPRFDALLLGSFAVVAVLLSAVGLYAVVAASVRRRDAEMGVRVAVGATAGDLQRLVVGEGVRLALAGALAGLALSVGVGRLVAGLLFEVAPLDPLSLLGAALLLLVVSAAAASLPAVRASRTDPAALLRSE